MKTSQIALIIIIIGAILLIIGTIALIWFIAKKVIDYKCKKNYEYEELSKANDVIYKIKNELENHREG